MEANAEALDIRPTGKWQLKVDIWPPAFLQTWWPSRGRARLNDPRLKGKA
jgi:hypothetical protein